MFSSTISSPFCRHLYNLVGVGTGSLLYRRFALLPLPRQRSFLQIYFFLLSAHKRRGFVSRNFSVGDQLPCRPPPFGTTLRAASRCQSRFNTSHFTPSPLVSKAFGYNQREGMGQDSEQCVCQRTWPCVLCVTQPMTVFCVHLVIDQPPDRGKWCGPSGHSAWTVHHVQITPCWGQCWVRVTLLQPARRAAVLAQPSSFRPHWLQYPGVYIRIPLHYGTYTLAPLPLVSAPHYPLTISLLLFLIFFSLSLSSQ